MVGVRHLEVDREVLRQLARALHPRGGEEDRERGHRGDADDERGGGGREPGRVPPGVVDREPAGRSEDAAEEPAQRPGERGDHQRQRQDQHREDDHAARRQPDQAVESLAPPRVEEGEAGPGGEEPAAHRQHRPPPQAPPGRRWCGGVP